MKKFKTTLDINGRTLSFETGIVAEQASAAVIARMGDTTVLATVTMGSNDTTLDYFPLSVEYVERLYAGGRIKGSRWVKREGRPTDDSVLTGRVIDRTIRPLFPKELKKDVQVVAHILSVDLENDPDIVAVNAVSAALAISKIPWAGPIGFMRVGLVNNELVVNPLETQYAESTLDLVVSSLNDRSIMIEAGAKEVEEKFVSEGIKLAKETNAKIIAMINDLVKEVGIEKIEVSKDEQLEDVKTLVSENYKDKMHALIAAGVNKEVGRELGTIADEIFNAEKEKMDAAGTPMTLDKKKIAAGVDYVFKRTVREMIVNEGKRPDGRKIKQIRPISAQVGLIPRVHGSALFARGETQVLSIATLGPLSMEQIIESPEGEEKKRYMHHYSFPPYSVGETGRMMSPNRREIGHGALAERALEPVIPSSETFPYAIRVVSETMSSNGSTSQASVCGSTLALMDAGVPISAPVAGIAIGLMTLDDKSVVLTDIIGLEDFAGDMDFKVAGTAKGITAIQMDTKIAGLTDAVVEETLVDAKNARLDVLKEMLAVMPESKKEVSQYAPKITMVKIDPEKIGGLIGPGGKMIKNIIATTGAQVDVEDDGSVSVSAVDEEAVKKAVEWIEGLTHEVSPNEVYEGTVKRMLNFGAFVEILPGKEGMVHVSEMSTDYVKDPADVLSLGQAVKVRVKEIDDQGRVNLSMLFGEDAEKKKEGGNGGGDRGGDRGPRDDKPRFESRERRSFGRGGRSSNSSGGAQGPRRDDAQGGIRNEFGSSYASKRPRR